MKTTLVFLTLVLSVAWSAPALPTKPLVHLALTASVEVEGKASTFNFSWSHENYVTWDAGGGWHTRWKSSHRSFVRILDDRYAILVWLPAVADRDLEHYRPNMVLIDRSDPRLLRLFPQLSAGDRRGEFHLAQLKFARSASRLSPKPMSKEEELLKSNVVARKYGYLYGMKFRKEQWSRSPRLSQLLAEQTGFALLGKPTGHREGLSSIWREFYGFNSGVVVMEKMKRDRFGFEVRNETWTPLSDAGVYWYREGLKETLAPVWVDFRGHRFNQSDHELLFDSTTEELIVVWRYSLPNLELSDSIAAQ